MYERRLRAQSNNDYDRSRIETPDKIGREQGVLQRKAVRSEGAGAQSNQASSPSIRPPESSAASARPL